MVLLYQDPHGKFLTEHTITQSVKDAGPGVNLTDFPSPVPQSGNDADAITKEANIDMSQST